jgi:hypothetical protein
MRRIGPSFLLLGALLLAVALLAPWALHAAQAGWTRLRSREEGRPVLVIVVGDPGAVARLRAAVAPERVVATADDGFALQEGRVVAASLEAAGPILMAAGLGRRPVEVWSASSMRGPDPLRPTPKRTGLPQGLASKPTLTLGEALMLLDQDFR